VFSLFEHQFPIKWYYSEFTKDQKPKLPCQEPTYCAILRQKLQLAMYDLSLKEYLLLRSFQQSGSVQTAKSYLINNLKEDAANVDVFWQDRKLHWTRLGFFRVS